jgi:hypothetical protein
MTQSTLEMLRLMTQYDNSGEPRPLFNYPSTVYGLLITFCVSSSPESMNVQQFLTAALQVASYLCVGFRLATRYRLQCLGYDDVFIIAFRVRTLLSTICNSRTALTVAFLQIVATVGTVTLCLAVDYGFGEHILDIGMANFMEFQKVRCRHRNTI